MNSEITLLKKIRFKVSITTIMGILLFANLITINYFESSIYTLIQYFFLLPLMLYTVRRINKMKKDDWIFMFFIFVMSALIVISSYLGNVIEYYWRASIYYAVLIITMCLFLIQAGHINRLKDIAIGGRIYLIVVLVLTDLLMILLPNRFYNISGRSIGTTLIGNKFNVTYAHLMLMFLSIFLEERIQVRNIKVILYAIIVIGICKFCDCTTALLGCCLFVILYFIPTKIKEVLSKPEIVIIVFFLCAFLLFAFNGILMSKPIQYLIKKVLHRDTTLTGRMNVYSYLFILIAKKLWFGYGYGSDIVKSTTIWYANAQNGLLDFIIHYGLSTAIALIFCVFVATAKNNKKNKNNFDGKNWHILIMVYVYMFMGIVEITYNKQFFFFITFLYAYSCLNELKKIHNVK